MDVRFNVFIQIKIRPKSCYMPFCYLIIDHINAIQLCFLAQVCIYLSITIMSIGTNLSKWDVLSFSTYKYVGMIALVAFGLIARSTTAYYAALAYVSGALVFFLMRTLKLRIEPEVRHFLLYLICS